LTNGYINLTYADYTHLTDSLVEVRLDQANFFFDKAYQMAEEFIPKS
jgi:hypothetical protein